jgi:hypothetical protein
MPGKIEHNEDYYLENGAVVFTALFHLNRGTCCGNGCRHCPYDPPYSKGNTVVDQKNKVKKQDQID